jgi:hypothetical protein
MFSHVLILWQAQQMSTFLAATLATNSTTPMDLSIAPSFSN